jgi:hypothetical protein
MSGPRAPPATTRATSQHPPLKFEEPVYRSGRNGLPICQAMDGRIIDRDKSFFDKADSQTIDGKTQHYNYDSVAGANLHVNCRCTLLPLRI